MLAYLFAQFIDIQIYHHWKRLTKGKHLWLELRLVGDNVEIGVYKLVVCDEFNDAHLFKRHD